MRQETLLLRLNSDLESNKFQSDEQKARNIVFHSWRHYYARKMTDILEAVLKYPPNRIKLREALILNLQKDNPKFSFSWLTLKSL
jgi:hypothetical protein